ncbi:MAG: hypothetical protein ABIN67_22715, partial [Ferruginibacter sp.]
MRNFYFIATCILLLTISSFAQQKTTLQFADVLQSNMVLQQNKPLTIWGTGVPGANIKINA